MTRPVGAMPPFGEARDLDVHYGAVEFGRRTRRLRRSASAPRCVAQLLAQIGAEFVARRNDDFVLDASVVGQHEIAVRAVAEQADDGGMLALDNLHDAAFGAAVGAAAGDAREDLVAVHGVADAVAADEEVAFDAWDRFVRNDETVAVAMGDHAAGNQIRIGGSLGLPDAARSSCCTGDGRSFAGARGLF